MIPLNVPTCTGSESAKVRLLLDNPELNNEGRFTREVVDWFRDRYAREHIFLTKSCTHALELSALMLDIQPGDEVILPSYTFVSSANAFVLRGGVPVFVDIHPATMNLNEDLVEAAITPRTKAIVVVHYSGRACNMERIRAIADQYQLYVVEDAAQAVLAKSGEQYLGTVGDIGCVSFDQMKNLSAGQGGLLIINHPDLWRKAEVIYENGTNKLEFLRGEAPNYRWIGKGSNYKLSELQAAFLAGQLEEADAIISRRQMLWQRYYEGLKELARAGSLGLPEALNPDQHNAHIFFIKVRDLEQRNELSEFLAEKGILGTFHYIPLHSTQFGLSHARFHGKDQFTTRESERILRLPLYHTLEESQVDYVLETLRLFYA